MTHLNIKHCHPDFSQKTREERGGEREGGKEGNSEC
jgi:hypothetical protein